jgi:two-component system, chemotaxis family, chemotaxis protein CheY
MATILLVDDSNLSRRILRRILEPAGHTIIEAPDGMSAIEHYFLERPDLVMLDMTMGGMHGLEVLSKLHQLDPQARVLVASADIQSSTQTMARESGAAGFVAKPFSEAPVLDAVRRVLARSEE